MTGSSGAPRSANGVVTLAASLIRTEECEAAMADALSTSPLPGDVGQAIRTVKAELRRQTGDVAAVFAEVNEAMRAEATAVAADREAGRPVWPVAQFRDIAAGTVPARVRCGTRHVPPAARRALGRGTCQLRRTEPFCGNVPRHRRRGLRRPGRGKAIDLPHLLVQAADRGAAGRQHGRGPGVPELLLEAQV